MCVNDCCVYILTAHVLRDSVFQQPECLHVFKTTAHSQLNTFYLFVIMNATTKKVMQL